MTFNITPVIQRFIDMQQLISEDPDLIEQQRDYQDEVDRIDRNLSVLPQTRQDMVMEAIDEANQSGFPVLWRWQVWVDGLSIPISMLQSPAPLPQPPEQIEQPVAQIFEQPPEQPPPIAAI